MQEKVLNRTIIHRFKKIFECLLSAKPTVGTGACFLTFYTIFMLQGY